MENFDIMPIKSKKAYMQIVESIISLIYEGKLLYGEKLYNESELMKMLNVSRPTLREALRVLEFLGTVTVSPRKGININKPLDSNTYMPLIYILMFEKADPIDLFELRRAIQVDMAGVAAEKAPKEEIKKLKRICEDMRERINDDYIIFARLDYEYHMQIVKAAGNKLSLKLMETLNIIMKKQLEETIKALSIEKREGTCYYHNRIYEYIRDGDIANSRKTMEEHLVRPYKNLIERVNK